MGGTEDGPTWAGRPLGHRPCSRWSLRCAPRAAAEAEAEAEAEAIRGWAAPVGRGRLPPCAATSRRPSRRPRRGWGAAPRRCRAAGPRRAMRWLITTPHRARRVAGSAWVLASALLPARGWAHSPLGWSRSVEPLADTCRLTAPSAAAHHLGLGVLWPALQAPGCVRHALGTSRSAAQGPVGWREDCCGGEARPTSPISRRHPGGLTEQVDRAACAIGQLARREGSAPP